MDRSVADNSRFASWQLFKSIRFLTLGFYNPSSNPNCDRCSSTPTTRMEPITPATHNQVANLPSNSAKILPSANDCNHLVVATPIDRINPQKMVAAGSQVSLAESNKCTECSKRDSLLIEKHLDVSKKSLLDGPPNGCKYVDGKRVRFDSRQLSNGQGTTMKQPIHIIVEPLNDESWRCDCRHCQFFSGWCCMPFALIVIIFVIILWAMYRWRDDDTNIPIEGNSTMSTSSKIIKPDSYETIQDGISY